MPDHLILIRSGPTDYDLQGRIRGTLEVPLSPAGIVAAEAAAEAIAGTDVEALYTSADIAAVETGRILGRGCGLRPRRLAKLGNLDQGLWQGMLVDEIRRKQPRLYRQWQDNPWAVAPPEGELLEDAVHRVEESLEPLVRRHRAGRIVLVVPQPLDQIVRWIVSGVSMGDLWAGEPQHPPVAELPLASQWRSAAPRPVPSRQQASG
jgi:broad specificity phosphatase PhoE